MFIFYDFETSSCELLGQILTYSFILVDASFKIHNELTGEIRLNRIQLPQLDAILTNRINLVEHQKTPQTEYKAAQKIFIFLSQQVEKYGYIPLVGFNSNSFDLSFLRNLLIRYGLNPYFMGKLTNSDVLHYAQYLAFTYPDTFIWQMRENKEGKIYYSFKLEDLAKNYEILDLNATQTHTAREDVILTIELVKMLQKHFNEPIKTFKSFQLLSKEIPTEGKTIQPDFDVARQKVRDFPDTQRLPEKFKYCYWLKILNSKKEYVALNLEQYETAETPLDCLKYINPNKHFFILEPCTSEEMDRLSSIIEKAKKDPFLQGLSMDQYFELIKKDWDIEYQIHELGFKRIDDLKLAVDKLLQNPQSYNETLEEFLKNRSAQTELPQKEKDTALIRLYNRAYLNYHPDVTKEQLHQYCIPRYVTGNLLRDKKDFETLQKQWDRLNQLLNKEDLSNEDATLLMAYKTYYKEFCLKNYLPLT